MVRARVVVLADDVRLPEGLEVTVLAPNAAESSGESILDIPTISLGGVRGSPAAILAALNSAPKVDSQWVDELEQLIADGARPPSALTAFGDESDALESR